jgi:carbamoyltransferase
MGMDTYILGISCYYHDAAAALVCNGEVIAAAQEERFTRIKHDARFPEHAIRYCLEDAGLTIDDLSAVVFYDKPLLKFERLLETYYRYAPSGLLSFLKAMPVWIKEKLFLKREIKNGLKAFGSYNLKNLNLLFTEHHLSHAASSFYPSPYREAALLTIDGVGEWTTASIAIGSGESIEVLKEMHFPDSVGLLYSAFTYYLGFRVNSGEYKLMGLAPYGHRNSTEVATFIELIRAELLEIFEDGSIRLNMKYFDYAVGLKMVKEKKWGDLFGFSRRKSEEEITQQHCNLAAAIQCVTEEIVLRLAQEAKRLTGLDRLCLSGGVALNCVANGRLIEEKIFEEVYVQPASGDAGGALGAALAASHIYFGQKRWFGNGNKDGMRGAYLGPSFDDRAIHLATRRFDSPQESFGDFGELCSIVASLLDQGQVVGWFQGRMEFGPRALGNRSILGDPRNSEMQRRINLKIKYRESFRPFAPAILEEDAADYFQMEGLSPYMLRVHQLSAARQLARPEDYETLSMSERLSLRRSELPAITHVDGSARIQTVSRHTNETFWQLLQAFKELTGCPALVNTSFNVRGEPIVCTPEEAYRCFMRTEMDYLVMGSLLFRKTEQPSWQKKDMWKEEFVLD